MQVITQDSEIEQSKLVGKREREIKQKQRRQNPKMYTLHSLNYPKRVQSDKKNPLVFNVIMKNNDPFLISDLVKMFELLRERAKELRSVFCLIELQNRLIISFRKVNSIIFSILLL